MSNKINDLFFNELSKKLNELFPKGKCKERGEALVLNAYANVLFRKYSKAEINKLSKGKNDR